MDPSIAMFFICPAESYLLIQFPQFVAKTPFSGLKLGSALRQKLSKGVLMMEETNRFEGNNSTRYGNYFNHDIEEN